MAYTGTISIAGLTGGFSYGFAPGGLTFAQIFDGVPQFYPGSMIQVQELLEIQTSVVQPELVGFSSGWFQPKLRLGTYQIGGFPINTAIREGNDGYLTNEIFEISRVSTYTITANPNVAFGKHEQISLDNCNWYSVPEIYLFPNDPTPEVGSRLYDLNPVYLGSNTISKAPLADTDFFQKIGQIGLYLAAGVEGVQLSYKVAIINDIYTDYEPAPVPTCQFLGSSCEAQFAAYAQANGVYSSENECVTASDRPCVQTTWVCPSDPTFIRTVWATTPI